MNRLHAVIGLVLGGGALWVALGTGILSDTPAETEPATSESAAAAVNAITWDDLVPADAPPPVYPDLFSDASEHAVFGEITDMNLLQPVSLAVNSGLNGQRVRIPGFIVPLDYDAQGRVGEFLLVPYFGACLHQPPPPANQIIHVTANPGPAPESLYDPIWVTGRMNVNVVESDFGTAAYTLAGEQFEPYEDLP